MILTDTHLANIFQTVKSLQNLPKSDRQSISNILNHKFTRI